MPQEKIFDIYPPKVPIYQEHDNVPKELLRKESKAKIEINTEEGGVNVLGKTIPGNFFEEELEVSQEFKATGKTKIAGKARGQIRVYNAYSTSSQSLIANTRFISAEGKLFKSIKAVTIPGGKQSGGG